MCCTVTGSISVEVAMIVVIWVVGGAVTLVGEVVTVVRNVSVETTVVRVLVNTKVVAVTAGAATVVVVVGRGKAEEQ